MRDLWRGLRLMFDISFSADAVRSVAVLITAAGQSASAPFSALGMKILVDGIVAHDRRRALVGALAIVLVAVLGRLFAFASFNVRMRLRENTELHLDLRLMALTAGIPGIEHHERPEYLDKVELVRKERGALANPFNPISWTLASIIQAVSVVGLMLAVHPLLALLPLFGIPSIVATYLGGRRSEMLYQSHAEPWRVMRHLLELGSEVDAAKEVRIFGLAPEILARRRRQFEAIEGDIVRLGRRNLLLTTLSWTTFGVGYVGAIAWVVHLALTGRATVGAVVLVLALGGQLNQQLDELGGNLTWAVHTHSAVTRMFWLIDHAAAAQARLEPAAPLPPPERLVHGIDLRGVSFAYPGTDKPVLETVDLFLPAGSTVAIVGDNGAGKTTLVKLLCRFYEPTTGSITVDGVGLDRLPVEAWRGRIAAGFQDFARLQLRARESVGVGDLAAVAGDAPVLVALERAAATELLSSLPEGLATQLGRDFDGGVDLSQGQWQKVALGRAMMRTAPLLLILDEPTASLDAPTEHALFERFAGAARRAAEGSGAITLLISHRFSTVRMADLILVIAGGRVAEMGDHAALLRAGGLYAQLFELQRRAYR